MKEDIYTLFIFVDGTRFYFKNNRLHREHGPAIKNALSSLVKFANDPEDIDFHLYTEVYPKKSSATYFKYTLSNGLKITMESPIRYMYPTAYYLEGKKHSKEEFERYHALKELEKELPTKDINIKKIKL